MAFSVEEVFGFHRYKSRKKRVNQPPRPRFAGPPLLQKGETFSNISIYITTLRLITMGQGFTSRSFSEGLGDEVL